MSHKHIRCPENPAENSPEWCKLNFIHVLFVSLYSLSSPQMLQYVHAQHPAQTFPTVLTDLLGHLVSSSRQ